MGSINVSLKFILICSWTHYVPTKQLLFIIFSLLSIEFYTKFSTWTTTNYLFLVCVFFRKTLRKNKKTKNRNLLRQSCACVSCIIRLQRRVASFLLDERRRRVWCDEKSWWLMEEYVWIQRSLDVKRKRKFRCSRAVLAVVTGTVVMVRVWWRWRRQIRTVVAGYRVPRAASVFGGLEQQNKMQISRRQPLYDGLDLGISGG